MTTGPQPDPKAPVAGALVWVDFHGAEGSEQTGVRPAIVVSMTEFNQRNYRSLVCPITSNMAPFPTKVFLPDDAPVRGAILCDQVRSLDRTGRGFRLIGQATPDVLARVRAVISQLMTDIA